MSEKAWKATAPGNDYHRCIETHEARESTPKTLKNDEILKYFLSSTEREKKKKKGQQFYNKFDCRMDRFDYFFTMHVWSLCLSSK